MAYRLFSDTLNTLRFGTLNEELGRELADLTVRCENAGATGTLTLKLTLKPGKAGQIEVVDDIAIKAPKEEKGTTILFSTPEGNLIREDPRQQQLEGLRSVDAETGELRRVN